MRGEVFEIQGKKIFAFGGGYSIDKAERKAKEALGKPKQWWKEEMPTKEEYENAIKNLNDCQWKVDYVFTHSCPTTYANYLVNSFDHHELPLTNFLDQIYEKLDFSHWYFGHFHKDEKINSHFTVVLEKIIAVL